MNSGAQLVKILFISPRFVYNRRIGGVFMEQWKNNARREPIIVDLETLVPKDHLLRKIEKVMDYDWLTVRCPGRKSGASHYLDI